MSSVMDSEYRSSANNSYYPPSTPVTAREAAIPTVSAPKVPWLAVSTFILLAGCLFAVYRWYLHTYAFDTGLDYFEPTFQTHWMWLFWTQITVLTACGIIAIPLLWFTRDRDLQNLAPDQELARYYLVLSVAALGSLIVVAGLGVFAEGDAAWHQLTIRDTDFTPTHISLQYFAIPSIALSLIIAFIWVHTRLPQFQNRLSLSMMILCGGPILMMPNIGFNEWGHTFFYMEELFSAPIHWGFLVFGWAAFALAGFVLQCLSRIKELTTLPSTVSAP